MAECLRMHARTNHWTARYISSGTRTIQQKFWRLSNAHTINDGTSECISNTHNIITGMQSCCFNLRWNLRESNDNCMALFRLMRVLQLYPATNHDIKQENCSSAAGQQRIRKNCNTVRGNTEFVSVTKTWYTRLESGTMSSWVVAPPGLSDTNFLHLHATYPVCRNKYIYPVPLRHSVTDEQQHLRYPHLCIRSCRLHLRCTMCCCQDLQCIVENCCHRIPGVDIWTGRSGKCYRRTIANFRSFPLSTFGKTKNADKDCIRILTTKWICHLYSIRCTGQRTHHFCCVVSPPGVQRKWIPPLATSATESCKHNVWSGPASATGRGFTITHTIFCGTVVRINNSQSIKY